MIPSYLTGERVALEMISRQHYQTARLSDRVILCRVLGKYIVYADPEDVGITPHLCLDGFWESWITIAMARMLKPGWCCVDIGANYGYYTLLMADAVESAGRVLAVEPQPQLAELLRLHPRSKWLAPSHNGASKSYCRYSFEKNASRGAAPSRADATLYREATAADDVVEVETVTLDQITADWPRVDLIKIDAEGAEESIWRGMRETLARNQGITIFMEMKCSRYANPSAFVREILGAGFPLRYIDYDATIKNLTEEQILTDRIEEDRMLFLRRE